MVDVRGLDAAEQRHYTGPIWVPDERYRVVGSDVVEVVATCSEVFLREGNRGRCVGSHAFAGEIGISFAQYSNLVFVFFVFATMGRLNLLQRLLGLQVLKNHIKKIKQSNGRFIYISNRGLRLRIHVY